MSLSRYRDVDIANLGVFLAGTLTCLVQSLVDHVRGDRHLSDPTNWSENQRCADILRIGVRCSLVLRGGGEIERIDCYADKVWLFGSATVVPGETRVLGNISSI